MKSKKTTAGRKNVNESLSYLIENELEKAEVVLAAKSVVDKLTKMIESLATLEGEEIMPMFDAMKLSFGADAAANFQKTVGDALRAATQNVMQAKDQISTEVDKLEGAIEGGGDLASLDLGSDEVEAPANDLGDTEDDIGDMEVDADLETDDDMDADMDGSAPVPPTPGDDPFADTGANAAGRARKESAAPRGRALSEAQRKLVRTLRESSNPDALLYATFRRQVKEGHTPVEAAKRVAAGFAIDLADVFAVVKDRLHEGYEKLVIGALQGAGIKNAYFKDGDLYVDASDKDRVEQELKKNRSIMKLPKIVTEAKKKAKKDDPCWDGYEMVSMKKKGKKDVPNCVPVDEAYQNEVDDTDMKAADKIADRMKSKPKQTPDTVRKEVEKMAGSVGKNPAKDTDKLAPIVQAKLDGMGKLSEKKRDK